MGNKATISKYLTETDDKVYITNISSHLRKGNSQTGIPSAGASNSRNMNEEAERPNFAHEWDNCV